ncbi:hypothetical protein AB6A40_009844 [Gnathostoma spinigerum]|uniref:Uncharacterized protein n=1 Tax=Gnathostoma spinigerum TaxID=75299 RepID=A0ABD6ET41_9BILA
MRALLYFRLLWAFETSAFVDLGYHITLLLLADEEKGCSGIFHHNQWHYTVVKVPYELISFLLPIWIVLLTFRSPQKSRTETGSVSHTSIFDNPHVEAVSDFVTVRNWRRRYRPLGGSHWAYVNPLSQITGRSRRTPRVRPGTSGEVGRLRQRAKSADANKLHRSVSAPTIVQTRQPTSGCAMITSPLDPIPEEVHSSCTSESVSASNSTIDSLTSVGTSGRPATAKKS